jgi:hypothetical protein
MYLEFILIALVTCIGISLIARMVLSINLLKPTVNPIKPPHNDDEEGGLNKFYDFPVVIFPTGSSLDLILQDRKPEVLYDCMKKKSVDSL